MQPSTKQTRAARLAQAIVRDWQSQQCIDQATPACMVCGRGYAPRGSRFCSGRCRDTFDAGAPVFAPPEIDRFFTRPKAGAGFRIDCAHCKRPFSSHGLRCCSIDCERSLCRRHERDRELAGNAFRSPRPPCETCGVPLPRWRNGRQVSKATKFCSRSCRDRAARNAFLAPGASQTDLRRETANKPPSNGLRLSGDVAASVLARARAVP
jgi:hypothetical protein